MICGTPVRRRSALAGLVALAAGLAGAELRLPSDLTGSCGPPVPAWRVDGVPPGATVAGFDTPHGRDLLVGGPRSDVGEPRLGDICLVTTGGWVRRRIATPTGILGRPALLRQVVLAGGSDGLLRLWPLTQGDDTPPVVSTGKTLAGGPLVFGERYAFAAERTVLVVDKLLDVAWKADLPDLVTLPLGADAGSLYAAAGRRIAAFGWADGQPAWQVDVGVAAVTGPLAAAGLVVLGFDDGTLRGLDAGNGGEVWRRPCSAPAVDGLALGGPWLFAALADGRLVGLDAATGEPQWERTLPAPVSGPVLGFGHLFAVAGDGKLHALPLAGGEGWTWAAPDEGGQPAALRGGPCLYERRVYVTTASGALLALDLPDATGPAPWPVPGGNAQRCGQAVPLDEAPAE